MKTWDVIVIGGGIIGLSLSIALRKRGATVLLVERGEPGREASHAAGGMLVDCPLETPAALQSLATASAHMYPEFARELELESGMKVDLRDFGTILFLSREHLGHPALTSPRMRPTSVSMAELEQLEPELSKAVFDDAERESIREEYEVEQSMGEIQEFFRAIRGRALYLKESSVDPRALAAAAFKTAKNRGVDFSSGDSVTAADMTAGRVTGVTTTKTSFLASKIVNCAGCWSGQISPSRLPTRPVKGQMLCLVVQSEESAQACNPGTRGLSHPAQ